MPKLTIEELDIISFLLRREIDECQEGWQLGSLIQSNIMKSALLKIKENENA